MLLHRVMWRRTCEIIEDAVVAGRAFLEFIVDASERAQQPLTLGPRAHQRLHRQENRLPLCYSTRCLLTDGESLHHKSN